MIHLRNISPGSSWPVVLRLSSAEILLLNVDLDLPCSFSSTFFYFLLLVFLSIHCPLPGVGDGGKWPGKPRTLPLLSPVRIIQLREKPTVRLRFLSLEHGTEWFTLHWMAYPLPYMSVDQTPQ